MILLDQLQPETMGQGSDSGGQNRDLPRGKFGYQNTYIYILYIYVYIY